MAEVTVIESPVSVRKEDQLRAMGIAVHAGWEMEALLILARQALDGNPDLLGLALRGLLGRMNQLNSATLAALSDDVADLGDLEHVVCRAGIIPAN